MESQDWLAWRLAGRSSRLVGGNTRRRSAASVAPTDARKLLLNKVSSAHFDFDRFPPGAGLAPWRQSTASLYSDLAEGRSRGLPRPGRRVQGGSAGLPSGDAHPDALSARPGARCLGGQGLFVVAGAARGRGAAAHDPRALASARRAHLRARLGLRLRLISSAGAFMSRTARCTACSSPTAGLENSSTARAWSVVMASCAGLTRGA